MGNFALQQIQEVTGVVAVHFTNPLPPMPSIPRLIRALLRRYALIRYAVTRFRLRLTVPGLVLDVGGAGQRVDSGAVLSVSDGGRLTVGKDTHIARGAQIKVSRGEITIGDDTFIGPWTTIVSRSKLYIGKNCLIAERVSIRDQDHFIHGALDIPISQAGFRSAPVVISDGVWICAGAVVLKGVTVGEGAVVAANAVVTQNVRAGAVVAGVPAREIGMRHGPST